MFLFIFATCLQSKLSRGFKTVLAEDVTVLLYVVLGAMSILRRSLTLSKVFRRNNVALASTQSEAFYDEDQKAMQETLKRIIEQDINPYVDEWEKAGEYPAHQVFKILGGAGLLGVNKPTEYGGMGLNLKYNVAINETLGNIRSKSKICCWQIVYL